MGNEEKESGFFRLPRWEQRYGSLPGADLVRKGLEDLRDGKRTVAALLVQIGRPRLRNVGVFVPKVHDSPDHLMYELLSQEDSDSAHSRYNALLRTLVSFERAAECANK